MNSDSILFAFWVAVFGFSYLVFLSLVLVVTIRGTGELKRLFRELANSEHGARTESDRGE